jgi:HlyD family secretion protein
MEFRSFGPVLDKHEAFRQAEGVDTPPILNLSAAAPKPKRRGRRKWPFILIAAVVLLGALLGWALHKKTPAISVQTEKVSRHTITETVIANGKIYPVVQVRISAEVSGEIIELKVKEGEFVHKGDLLLKINPKTPLANLNQAKASLESSRASVATATASLEKAEADYKRNKSLLDKNLLAESDFTGIKTTLDIARAQLQGARHSVELAQGAVDSAQDSFDKTTITAPVDGTITRLNSQLGERVLGTVQNAGTDIMTICDLSQMEARVDIGEMDILLLKPGQKATLEVDSFKDKKFAGLVTDVASASKDMNASSALGGYGGSSSSSGQSATQFQVRIRLTEENELRPGMSVNATIETRTRTNAIAAPIASVTTRIIKPKARQEAATKTNGVAAAATNVATTNVVSGGQTNEAKADKKSEGGNKPVDVLFVVEGDHVKTVPVKIGICDDNFWEITDGLKEGQEIVTGGYHAISRDLEDDKKIIKGGGARPDFAKPKS